MMREHADVVVAGGGPVGLLMAIELTLGGARAVVLERLTEPSTVLKAGSLGTLASEALERRGMAAAIAAEEASSREAVAAFAKEAGADLRGQSSRFAGHFAGLFLIRQDVQKEPERRPRAVRQKGLEEMLAARARSLSIEVRRGCEIVNVSQGADSATVAWESTNGTGELCCPYLVACDGGRSPIRKMFGFDFPGTAPTLTGHQAIVDVDHPARLLPMGWQRTRAGVFAYGPQPGRLYLLEFDGPPKDRNAPITCNEIEESLRRVSGADVRVRSVTSATRWTDNCRLAETYRKGRVLLAGDAAHIHPPFGGQGLNLGLVDAANLGWKLSSVVRGEMPADLLDTYTAERHPVAEGVLSNTRAQVAIMKPDAQSGAMRAIVADMMRLDDVNRMFGEMMSGLNTRYDLGGDQDAVGRLLGNSAVQTADGEISIYDLMQDGQGLLVDASSNARASSIAGAATNRVRCITTKERISMLIRPDACVAWVGSGDDTGGLEGALTRWFGRLQRAMPHMSRQAA